MKNSLTQKLRNSIITGVVGLSSLVSGCTQVVYRFNVDSVPRNANVFVNGKFYSNTPTMIEYILKQENFPDEASFPPIDCAKQGYFPERLDVSKIRAPQKGEYREHLDGGKSATYSHTFFLKSDPNYRPEPQPESNFRISIGGILLLPLNRK